MASILAGVDLCEVASYKNHNWEAIEAYDASQSGCKSTEGSEVAAILPSGDSFTYGFKEETDLPTDVDLINRFDVICRFCLEEKKCLMDIFACSDNIVMVVESLVNIKIGSDDMLPKQICRNCRELVNQCLAFKQQIASTDTALRRCIDQFKQVEAATKQEGVETFVPGIAEQHFFDTKSESLNELNEVHKFEELIEEEDYLRYSTVSAKNANSYSVCVETPMEYGGDAIVHSPEGPSNVIASHAHVEGKIQASGKCEQCENAFSCNSHLHWNIKSHTENQKTETIGHMSSHTTPNASEEQHPNAFKCAKCNESFALEHDLYNHGSLRPEDNKIQCCQCGQDFSELIHFQRHVKTHYKDNPHCLKNPTLVRKKLSRPVCQKTDEKPFICNVCDKSFRLRCNLSIHLRLHSGEKPYECSHCPKSFRLSSTLASHVRTHTGEKPYKCSHCLKSYGSSSSFAVHVRKHTGEKPYICIYCSKSFSESSAAAYHIRTHTGEKPYKCLQCPKSFSRSSTLSVHVRTHTGEKPYKCPHCSETFRTSSSLTIHIRTHTGEKPYKCIQCSKSFSRSTTLAVHVRTHTGEKPHKCPHCSKRFQCSSGLAGHVRTHTGEKPYKCSQCTKLFGNSSALADHVRTHSEEKPYKCSHCSKSFVRPSKLAAHIRTHTSEKLCKCPHCSESFDSSSALANHASTHTGENSNICSTLSNSSHDNIHLQTGSGVDK